MDNIEIIKALEAVLFTSGEPVSKSRIAQTFEITEKQAASLAESAKKHIKEFGASQ